MTRDQLINLSVFSFPLIKWGPSDLSCQAGRLSGAPLCSRIYCICHYSSRLREVITGDLLPSSSMIKELSQEFGLPISQEDLTEGKLLSVSPPPAPSLEDFRSRNSTLTSEIQAHQEKYLQWRNTMILKNRDQKYSLIQVGAPTPRHPRPPAACVCFPGQGSQAGWAGSAACRAQLRQEICLPTLEYLVLPER